MTGVRSSSLYATLTVSIGITFHTPLSGEFLEFGNKQSSTNEEGHSFNFPAESSIDQQRSASSGKLAPLIEHSERSGRRRHQETVTARYQALDIFSVGVGMAAGNV